MSTTATTGYFVGPDSSPDKYRLRRMVGSGGEAQLWQAELVVAGTAEPVAMKVLLPERGADFVRLSARWAEQAELLRFVQHPGVVGVREHFEGAPMHGAEATSGPGRQLYLVMNWVEGDSLRDWAVLHQGPAATLEVLRHLDQLAEVLDLLHSGRATPGGRPLVHGDLSPGNLMINGDGQAVLVDFGLIRASLHHTAGPMGTPGFAAPETWNRGEYSPASDRYGFGALAYYALTGAPPLGSPEQLRAGLMSNPLLAGRNPTDITHLLSIFSADPAQRPPSALQWVRYLRQTATTTHPPSGGSVPLPRRPDPVPPTAQPNAEVRGFARTTWAEQQTTPPAAPPAGRGRAWLAAAVAAIVLVAVIVAVSALSTGGRTGTSAQPDQSTATASAPTAAPTRATRTSSTATAPSATFAQQPETFRQRYAPTQLVVALGNCGTSAPNVDLSVPRTSSSGFADFTYESCATKPHVDWRTGDVDVAVLPDGSTPTAETCNDAIERSLLATGQVMVRSGEPQVVCLRRTQRAVQSEGIERVISAVQITAVNTGSIGVTAYSWDIDG